MSVKKRKAPRKENTQRIVYIVGKSIPPQSNTKSIVHANVATQQEVKEIGSHSIVIIVVGHILKKRANTIKMEEKTPKRRKVIIVLEDVSRWLEHQKKLSR